MKAVVKVDSKGRVAIPKKIREEASIKPRDLVLVFLEGEKITIKPLESIADKYYGAFRVERWPEDLDEFLVEAVGKWWMGRST